MEEKENVFYVGLCMAGAVSAGAYTAGVIDYLTEALEKYESYRKANADTPGTPKHKVEIPVMGGASAGGMTSIITAAALQYKDFQHVTAPGDDKLAQHPENGLYHSWVDLVNDDMFPIMLENDDIDESKGVDSLLNSDFIQTIASRMLTPADGVKWRDIPGYFSKNLKIFVTLSNLEGYTYDVNFNAPQAGGKHPYYMQIHNDFACFKFNEDKSMKSSSPVDEKEAGVDGWIPLDIPNQTNVEIAKQAAMSTGAFPVGLKARDLTRPTDQVRKIPFLSKFMDKVVLPVPVYKTENIDGGMIDNEPFDNVRFVLTEVTGQCEVKEYQDYNRFKSTVVMVAPFPSVKPKHITFEEKLLGVLGLTFPAVVSQMRAKPADLVDAWDEKCAGQFLIDPSRTKSDDKVDAGKTIIGDKAIACGSIDGFSGFLSKDFRVHDFFLGRYNCYNFLKYYFTIPEEAAKNNPIFSVSYGDPNTVPGKFKVDNGFQIIPITDDTAPINPAWPVQSWDNFSRFGGPLRRRTSKVILNIIDYKWYWKWFLTAVLYLGGRRFLAGKLLDSIQKQLVAWELV